LGQTAFLPQNQLIDWIGVTEDKYSKKDMW